jgi:hypothetical protein
MSEGGEAENPFKGIEGWAGSLLSTSPAAFTPTPTLCRRGCACIQFSDSNHQFFYGPRRERSDNDPTDWARIILLIPKNWGVVQSVGRRTVNADGVGSNPTAPARLPAAYPFVVGKPAAIQPFQPPSMEMTLV